MSRKNRSNRTAGLGLLEVVIAFAILGIALAVFLDAAALGARGGAKASAATHALLAAESLMAEVGKTVPLRSGTESGTLADGSRFERRIARLGGEDNASVRTYEVSVSVTPAGGGTVRLVTLRLGLREGRS